MRSAVQVKLRGENKYDGMCRAATAEDSIIIEWYVVQ